MKHQYDLYTAQQTRELDRTAIEQCGIEGLELMQRAGRSVFEHLRRQWPEAQQLAIFCGAGNNAGDGYVVAHLAHEAGMTAHVYTLADPEQLKADARQAWQTCVQDGVSIEPFVSGMHRDTHVVVDALLGTGLERELQGDWLTAVDCMNVSPWPVIAIDIPSGIHADSGQIMGAAVRADMTVSFIGLNRGLFTGAAPEYTGKVEYDDLQIDDECYRDVISEVSLIADDARNYLHSRSRVVHKGACGHVLVVGGNRGMSGAPVLAARAALRTGAGLVSVVTRPQHTATVVAAQPELMAHGVDAGDSLGALLKKASVVVIGPGLGQDDWARSLLGQVLESRLPMVIDADALNLLAKDPMHSENWVLTPHAGEAARLLGRPVNEINDDRFMAIKQLQHQYGGISVLKGAGTLIARPDIRVCQYGNPGMATAGMGDLLSGVIASLIGQGLTNAHAAELAVWVHARAGDMEAGQSGERGMVASDLLPHIRAILNG